MNAVKRVLLKNGRVIDPSQEMDQVADVLAVDGKIADVAPNIAAKGAEVFDCAGMWVVPGLVDAHCHLREPGFERKDTITTGTRAAARGGFTTIVAMANVNPVPDCLNAYNKILKLIEEKACVKVVQVASVTKDSKGRDLSDMATLAASGVKIFSDDGLYIDQAAVLYQALRWAAKLNVTIALHEEDTSLKLFWPTAYEPLNEVMAISRDLEILRVAGGKLHFQHLSTARSVELIRGAKREGLPVTAEVCPHHLTLTKDILLKEGTYAKMAPPLRTEADIVALIEGLDDGTIDLIATDHAPHTVDDKNTIFDMAANGIVGFETALPVLLTKLVHEKGFSPSWLIRRLTCLPAQVCDLPGGTLSKAGQADMCVINPDVEWTIDSGRFASTSRNTPYHGWPVKGRVAMTFVDGQLIYDGRSEWNT